MMFGISFPELIVILVVALIVVGPDKLPGLARSLAKGLTELKKTLNQVKESFAEENEALHSLHRDLRTTTDELRTQLLDTDLTEWKPIPEPAVVDGNRPVIDVETEARAVEAELRDQDDWTGATAAAEPQEEQPEVSDLASVTPTVDATAAADRQEGQPPSPETSAAASKSAGDSAQAS